MKIEIYKGIPVRYLNVTTKDDEDTIIAVSTQTIGDLVTLSFEQHNDYNEEIEDLDCLINYYIEDNVFTEFTDDEVVKHINWQIDFNHYKGLTES